jgi:hypothetical protein
MATKKGTKKPTKPTRPKPAKPTKLPPIKKKPVAIEE